MPKLSDQQVASATQNGFDPNDTGADLKPLPTDANQAYVYRLVDVTAGISRGGAGRPQWTWMLTLDDRYHPEFVGRGYLEKVWEHTSVEPGKEAEVARMLNKFGYTPDTETDELILDKATILVFPAQDKYNGRTTMKIRRTAAHSEEDYPQVELDDEGNPFQADIAAMDAAEDAKTAEGVATADPWAKDVKDAEDAKDDGTEENMF